MTDPCDAPPDGELRFLALGDSYTIGQSVPEADRWPVQLADMLRERGFKVDDPEIVAQTGWTTRDLAKAIESRDLQADYQLVSLLIGVNNQYRGQSESDYAGDFAELLDQSIQFAGGDKNRVIVLSIPDWGVTPYGANFNPAVVSEEIDRFNAINRQITEEASIAYIDVTPVSRKAVDNPALIADDNLHPSGAMYGEWAKLALPAACAALSTE